MTMKGTVTTMGNRRTTTGRLQSLSAGASVLALLLAAGGIMAVATMPALAACDATAPTTGQTVTCDTDPPNPETDGIVIAAGTGDVKIIILPGAILETSGGPALTIGASNGASSLFISHDQLFDNQGIIRTIGNNAPAILVAPDPAPDFGNSTAVLTSVHFGMVETSGNDSPGLVYGEFGGGDGTDGTFVASDITATIATAGDRSPGLINGGIGAGQIDSDGFIGMAGHTYFVTTQGHDSPGVIFNALGDAGATQEAVFIDMQFTADTVGDRSPGVIFGATRTDTPSALISNFHAVDMGAFVTTQGDDSIGFFFGPGARPSGDFTVSAIGIHGDIVTAGDNSHGVIVTEGLSNARPGQNVQITLAFNGPLSATTSGDNSHGIILGDGLGTNRTDMNFVSSLRIGNGWSATTSGDNSHALVISEHTTLTLDEANLDALTANGTVVNGTIDSFDGFVATGAGGRAVMNHGMIYGTFTVGDGVVGNLANNGLIESAAGAGGVAVQFTGATNDIFELQTQGVVIGSVEAGAGTDTFVLGGSGAASFDVALIGSQYNGFEQFAKTGDSVWTLTGTNTIAASFALDQGTLVQNAMLANLAMTVGSGGTLAGTGTLGAVTVGDGGTLAPGNSIGTINVATLTLLPGATYEVEINGGGNVAGVNNDLVVVAGAATVNAGAILHVTPENGTDDGATYAASTTYTIIQAGTLTVDALPVVTDDFAFLDFTASYDLALGEFYITSGAAAASFCLPGASFNQCSTGEAVRALGPGNPVYDAVLGLSPGDASRAFNLASGEIHASGQHVTGQAFALFSRTLRQQAAAVSGTGGQTGAFAAALGGRGQVDGDGNAASLDWWTAGMAAGYQIELGSGAAVAGIAVGYLRSGGRVDGRRSALDADGFHAGVYGGWSEGPFSLAGSLAYAAHSLATTRRIAVGGLRETARADYWSHSVGFSGQAAYGFELGAGTTISPLLTVDAGWSGHGGFRERGAGALNLRGRSEGWARFDTGIGLALSHVVATGSGRLALDGRVLWEHAFADVVPDQDMAFAGGGSRFEVRGPDAGRDRLRLGLGLSFAASDALTIRASYDGMLARRQQGHGGSLGISFRF